MKTSKEIAFIILSALIESGFIEKPEDDPIRDPMGREEIALDQCQLMIESILNEEIRQ